VHNAAWGALGAFTATSFPLLVNNYLVGDYGVLIVLGAVIGSVFVGRMLRSGMDKAQPGSAAPEGAPVAK
jgi:hypothetical protein